MDSIFSSELSHIKHDHRGHYIKYLENAAYALEYNLSHLLPEGSTVCVLYPKSILTKILPSIAKEKKLRVILVGSNAQLIGALIHANLLAPNGEPDVFIGEPAGFSTHGVFVLPEESEVWRNNQVIAVGTALQFSAHRPAKFDMVSAFKVISELGVLPYELFSEKAPKIANLS